MYEEAGERQEGGTCRWVSWEEQVGRQEWGVRWGEKVRGGLEEEVTVRKAVPWHGTAIRRAGAIFQVEM